MSSDEDDYMSEKFLASVEKNDTRPGLIDKKKQLDMQRPKAKPHIPPISKKKLEAENREKGLETSLSSSNKGFAMLQKMGYKPGMGIGKQEKGRIEPVGIEVKTGRGGLGRDSYRKRTAADMVVWRAKRKKMEETLTSSFQSQMSARFTLRNAERDLRTAQKACQTLDLQQNVTEPGEGWFWPPLPVTESVEEDGEKEEEEEQEVPPDVDSRLGGEEEEEEKEITHTYEPVLDFSDPEKLEILTGYLRSAYVYCIWCGTCYGDAEDLASNCPGNSASAHDE